MIDENIIRNFLKMYGLADAKFELVGGGLSSFALLVKNNADKYIIKIASRESNLPVEANLGNYLHSENIPSAEVIKNDSGELISNIGDLCGVLFSFCDGGPVAWGDLSNDFSENMAVLLAKMHSVALNGMDIRAKDYDGCKIRIIDGVTNDKIIEKFNEINKINLDFAGFRRGIIHGDLTRKNLLIADDKSTINAVIDFGDAHRDYIVWDIAILITHVFITKTYGIDWNAIKVFFNKYNSILPLNKEEKDAIIPLIKIRNLNLAIEVNQAAKSDKENIEELLSIENSVMTKISLVEEGQNKLSEIFNG